MTTILIVLYFLINLIYSINLLIPNETSSYSGNYKSYDSSFYEHLRDNKINILYFFMGIFIAIPFIIIFAFIICLENIIHFIKEK